MNFRLKTSKQTGEKLVSLQSTTGLTWNILSRLAITLSIRETDPPIPVQDKGGVDIHRNALTGENDYTYKAIIRQYSKEFISDDEYFPDLFNAHLERGIQLLENEYQHAGNYEKLLINLLKLES